ncbi:MAG: hypothetical protein HOV79_00465 [Hamadaea sp.]|nr:hypothetical protein [Hamadaea sp.]
MAVTLTFDATLARVRITATALAAADVALVERSTDQVRWTTVRGASAWPVTAGAFAKTLDDYEFAPGVVNYYRVRGVQTGPSTFVAAGAASSGANGPRTPGMPAGVVAGDTVFVLASTRNSGTGTVDTPANWQQVAASGNLALLGRVYDGVWVMPTITFTGGAVGEDTLAQSAAFRNVGLTPLVTPVTQLNASAQDIAFGAVTVPQDNCTLIVAGWKQDDYTSAATAGMTEIQELSSAAGNDASQIWNRLIQTTKANLAAGSIVITGGAAAISRSLVAVFGKQEYLNEQTANLTPAQTGVWLKSITQPYLNQQVTARPAPARSRGARGGTFDVVNRSDPVAVLDLGGSERFDLGLKTDTADDAEALDLLAASGDVLLLQVPAGSRLPSGYVQLVGDARRVPLGASETTHWVLPLRVVAAPDPDVTGSTSTWQAILNNFATWADVMANFATWKDVLDYVASPSDVIVP